MDEPLPQLWIVGGKQVGKYSLVAQLLNRQVAKQDGFAWEIDTKYYKANVNVCIKHATATDHTIPQTSVSCEAVVLVFDASDPSSFDAVRDWAAINDTSDVEIKLLVANKVDKLFSEGTVQRTQAMQNAIEWSVDGLYEYIETSATDQTVDRALELDGDVSGTTRLAGALQAHMWPGLQEKLKPNKERSENVEKDFKQDQCSCTNTVHSPEMQHNTPASKDELPADAEDPSEAGLEEFEKVFAEMQGARERFAHLGDNERREAAAALALRLANMLGFNEDDSDSGVSDDSVGLEQNDTQPHQNGSRDQHTNSSAHC